MLFFAASGIPGGPFPWWGGERPAGLLTAIDVIIEDRDLEITHS